MSIFVCQLLNHRLDESIGLSIV